MMPTSDRTPALRTMKKSGKIQLILIILGLLLIGAFFSLLITPDILEIDVNAHALNTYSKSSVSLLSKRVLGWLPTDIVRSHSIVDVSEPDWSQEFWTPIDVELGEDPLITLCKLNFKEYSKSPHLYPMFRELEEMSKCQGHNRRKDKLSHLMAELKAKKGTPEGTIISPSGFVFHESRVGSTLVANTLASDPFSMVFSESPPPAAVLLHCYKCERSKQIQNFRDVITLMGNSPVHKHLFFKFQSITSTTMEIALEAFPEAKFAFVYRNSVQTMMSHMDPKKGAVNSPCLRSMRGNTPTDVQNALDKLPHGKKPSEAFCAAHLNMLCQSALRAYNKYGVTHDDGGHIKQRGMLINYESLPGIVPRALLPLFGIEPNEAWLKKMIAESKVYSKGHGESKNFQSDSHDKEERATDKINLYAKLVLETSYKAMLKIGLESLHSISPADYDSLANASDGVGISDPTTVNWGLLKEVPSHASLPHVQRQAIQDARAHQREEDIALSEAKLGLAAASGLADGAVVGKEVSGNINLNLRGKAAHGTLAEHSHALRNRDYIPWSPFSNNHKSTSYYTSPVGACGHLVPGARYPPEFSVVDIVNNWNPDNTEIPAQHYDTLCHFNYQNKEQKALALEYRNEEVPFVVYNVPEIDEVVTKWSDMDYLHSRLGSKKYRSETSKDNHFMYWNGHKNAATVTTGGKAWEEPTKFVAMEFEDFIETAIKGQNMTLEERKHAYFRLTSDAGSDWLSRELKFFEQKPSLFMKEPEEIKGIHCRFGMRGVTAETHFDGSRNFVVQLGGLRRWLLFHPDQCDNLYLLPTGHPSGRHISFDMSAPVDEILPKYPKFAKLMGVEVIMQPGDAIFIPTHWFHHIISLNLNYQCNARSGRDYTPYMDIIRKCGFA